MASEKKKRKLKNSYCEGGIRMTDEEMAKESLISYRKEPKWAGKMFMQDENTCYKDGFNDGYNKANEWHFVSKEGFPSKDDIYLIIRNDGLHLGDYCCGGDGDIDCQSWCDYPSEEEIQDDSVIAWKEIVLPELPTEN